MMNIIVPVLVWHHNITPSMRELIFSLSLLYAYTYTYICFHRSRSYSMAILISTSVKGQTAEGYDQVSVFLHQAVKTAPGFIMHCAYPSEDDWHVVEIWNSKAEADAFFAQHVAPNLPKGIVPKRQYFELHSLVTP
jgi:quinol monooxygenase YgiN